MGIKLGKGPDKKNFVPDVVKIELKGPNRSPFNILDLPGLVSNDTDINETEEAGPEALAMQYISRPENIVMYVCV